MVKAFTRGQQLVYAAALFEARGIFNVYDRPSKNVVYKQIRVRIRADSEAPMLLLTELFGGTFSKPTSENRRWWEYRLSGEEAKAAMRKLRPYLLARGEQVDTLLAA